MKSLAVNITIITASVFLFPYAFSVDHMKEFEQSQIVYGIPLAQTPLHVAASKSCGFKAVEELLQTADHRNENIGDLLFVQNEHGRTPLHGAADFLTVGELLYKDRWNSVLWLDLTETKRLVFMQDLEGKTVFHRAAARGDNRIIHDLLEVLIQCRVSLEEYLALLCICMPGRKALIHQAAEWDKDRWMLRTLIPKISDQRDFIRIMQVRDDCKDQRWTIFHYVAAWGCASTMEYLVSRYGDKYEAGKAALAMKDVYGRTPLHLAAEHGNTEVAEKIIEFFESKSDAREALEAWDNAGQEPWEMAVAYGNGHMREMLTREPRCCFYFWQ